MRATHAPPFPVFADNDMRIFDSHCHLDDKSYQNDLDAVLGRAEANQVAAVMAVGIDLATSKTAVRLANKYPRIVAAAGVHPHDAESCTDVVISDLSELARKGNVNAWGEIGLDYNRMFSPEKDQEKWFVRQIEAAAGLNLPMIFHERDTNGRFFELLKTHLPGKYQKRQGVVHCFSGTRRDLDNYLSLGLHIGITGIITMKERGKSLREMAINIPVDRLLVETDAPYLTPAPRRNKYRRNEPAFVRDVLLKLAEVRNEPPETLAELIWMNTCRLFGCINPPASPAVNRPPF